MSSMSEKMLPVMFGFVVGMFAFSAAFVSGLPDEIFSVKIVDVKAAQHFMSVGAMVFGIVAAGFSAVHRNAVMTMRGSEVMDFAFKTGFIVETMEYPMDCLYAGLLLALAAALGFAFGLDPVDGVLELTTHSLWFGFVMGCIAVVIAFTLRNEILMTRMVKRFIEEKHRY